MITRLLIVICTILSVSTSFGQEEGTPTPHAIRMDFKLPTALSNRSFKSVMSGLADIDLTYQYHLENINLIFGGGVKYDFWNLESGVFTNDIVTGKLEVITPQLSIGYRSIIGEKAFIDYEILGGYANIITSSNKLAARYNQSGVIVTPKLSFYLKATNLLYFGASLNYAFMDATFTPDNVGLTSFPASDPKQNIGKYQYFSVGFGFHAIIPTFK